jgi:hypothetical protein
MTLKVLCSFIFWIKSINMLLIGFQTQKKNAMKQDYQDTGYLDLPTGELCYCECYDLGMI